MNLTQKYFEQKINYGGEIMTVGAVIVDLKKLGGTFKMVNAYIMGALQKKDLMKKES